MLPVTLIIGILVTIAEPDLQVLAKQISDAVPDLLLIISVAVGMGLFLLISVVRMLLQIQLSHILIGCYILVFVLAAFVPSEFLAVAFDSGAVASGPMTATFVLPFTMGACEAAGGNIMMDAFGVVALVAMTPLFTVQIVGLIYKRKMAITASDEDEALVSISQTIEDQKIRDRWGRSEYSDEESRFDAEVDMDYAASPEWAEEVISEQIARRIANDNDYIDFEEPEDNDENGA
jgi:hypothetical protein